MPSTAPSRIRWVPIFLEAAFVVLGVVLALGANQWREGRQARARAETALTSIRREIETNRASVASALDYHLRLDSTMRAHEARGAERIDDPRAFLRGYIAPATLLRAAWDAAIATEALHPLPYEDVIALGRVYEAEQSYSIQAERAGGLIYERLFDGGHDALRSDYAAVHRLVMTFWYQECRLLDRYDEALEALGAEAGPPGPELCRRLAASRGEGT